MASRLSQVSAHLSSTHSRGLLTGDVAIITGEFSFPITQFQLACSSFWAGAGQVRFCSLLVDKRIPLS